MNYRIEQKPAFNVVGFSLPVSTVGGSNNIEIPKFWDRCLADGRVQKLDTMAGTFGTLGLCTDFHATKQSFTYVIGVVAQEGSTPSPDMSSFHLPEATYAVFSCIGAMPHAIQRTWHLIMTEWLPSSKYTQAGHMNFELYPVFPQGDQRGDPSSPQCYTEIWIPIREK